MPEVVIVPYRPDTNEREGNWKRVRAQWEGWDIHHADSDGEIFLRAQALNRAAAAAGDWEVAVIADSDLLLANVVQADYAVERARKTKGYIVCYDIFYYLTEATSQLVRAGEAPRPDMADEHLIQIWGGMFAVHRELWDALGGFSDTYPGWGGEDGNFIVRAREREAVMDRVPGACYHMKHPLVKGAR